MQKKSALSSKFEFKVVLLGDGAVGKTSLKRRALGEAMTQKYASTVGVDFGAYEITVKNYKIILQIWDLAGQERFRQMVHVYFSGMKGALLVYDITRPDTYKSLVEWVQTLVDNKYTQLPLVLVANKVDLAQSQGLVPQEHGQRFADYLRELTGSRVPFVETSALTGRGVQKAFEMLGLMVLQDNL